MREGGLKYNKHKDEGVDMDTGEIVKPIKERFFCGRITQDLDWMLKLNLNETRFIIFLASHSRPDGLTGMNPFMEEYIENNLGLSYQTLRLTIISLKEKDYMREVRKNVYMVHPLTVYVGTSRQIGKRMAHYLELEEYITK